jgi:hypothetical protein
MLKGLRKDTYEAAWGMLPAAYAAVKRHAGGGTKQEMNRIFRMAIILGAQAVAS